MLLNVIETRCVWGVMLKRPGDRLLKDILDLTDDVWEIQMPYIVPTYASLK